MFNKKKKNSNKVPVDNHLMEKFIYLIDNSVVKDENNVQGRCVSNGVTVDYTISIYDKIQVVLYPENDPRSKYINLDSGYSKILAPILRKKIKKGIDVAKQKESDERAKEKMESINIVSSIEIPDK